MNKEVVKSRMQSLISLYTTERDQAIADINLVLLTEEYDADINITHKIKMIMDRIVSANSGIKETQEMWIRMNVLEDPQNENIVKTNEDLK